MKLVRSPLNYTGGKFRLLPQLLEHFPKKIDTFYDAFTGGGSVAINAPGEKVIGIDIQKDVIFLLKWLANTPGEEVVKSCDLLIDSCDLSRSDLYGYEHYGAVSSHGLADVNRKAYNRFRQAYKSGDAVEDPARFMVLLAYAFNNQVRFNKKGGFNTPVGKRDFNKVMRNKLLRFCDETKKRKIDFEARSFETLNPGAFSKNDFVYADPPYLITTACYNESGGWGVGEEKALLAWLDKIDQAGIRFALSNVFEHKGKTNHILTDWCRRPGLNIIEMDMHYNNASYQTRADGTTREVLVTNYNQIEATP